MDKANGDETYCTLFDGLGSVVALCDVNSALVQKTVTAANGGPYPPPEERSCLVTC